MAHRLVAVLLSGLLSGLALTLVACGSDESSSPSSSATSSPANAQLCHSLTGLSDNVRTMTTASSLSEFRSGFDAAKKNFAEVKPAASDAYGPQVDAVQRALTDFGQALQSAGEGGAGASLQRIGAAAVDLGTSVQQLATDLPCPDTGSSG